MELLFLSLVVSVALKVSSAIQPTLLQNARCQASCQTKIPGDLDCSTSDCQKCIEPCNGDFISLSSCQASCGQSSLCNESCAFLDNMIATNSTYTGSVPPPGTPFAIEKTFDYMLLNWNRPVNTSNIGVTYIVMMSYGGDLTSNGWIQLNQVYLSNSAKVSDFYLCKNIKWFYETIFGSRKTYNGIYYRFYVIAVTQYDRPTSGSMSDKIWLPRPERPANVAFSLVGFGPEKYGLDELQFYGNWTGHTGSVSRYFVTWNGSNCFKEPRAHHRRYSTTSEFIRLYLAYDQLNGCRNVFKVSALAGCSVSHPVTSVVVNPGCRAITNFPQKLCCRVDPPQSLGPEELMVRNLRRTKLAISANGTFSFNISWDDPRYLKRTGCENLLHFFTYRWGDPNESRPCLFPWLCPEERWGQISFTLNNKVSFQGLKPGKTFKFQIVPNIAFNEGKIQQLNFTIQPEESERKVRNVNVAAITSPSGKCYLLVQWDKPGYDNGVIQYLMNYTLGGGEFVLKSLNITKILIPLATRSTPTGISFTVTPVYTDFDGVPIHRFVSIPESNPCYHLPDYSLLAHPNDCRKFLLCYAGKTIEYSCDNQSVRGGRRFKKLCRRNCGRPGRPKYYRSQRSGFIRTKYYYRK